MGGGGDQPEIAGTPPLALVVPALDQTRVVQALEVPSHAIRMQAELLCQLLGPHSGLALDQVGEDTRPGLLREHVAAAAARQIHRGI